MPKRDGRIDAKIAGPTWDIIRERFRRVHDLLLKVDEAAASELTTIYVKYKVADEALASVFAVVWIKSAKQVVLGLSTPEKINDPVVTKAPSGMKYAGLTSYVRIGEDFEVPNKLPEWMKLAFDHAKKSAD